MNKYPINSKVIINSSFSNSKEPFCAGMMEYIGKEATIIDYTYSAREGYGWYSLDVDGGRYYWMEEMLDEAITSNTLSVESISCFSNLDGTYKVDVKTKKGDNCFYTISFPKMDIDWNGEKPPEFYTVEHPKNVDMYVNYKDYECEYVLTVNEED